MELTNPLDHHLTKLDFHVNVNVIFLFNIIQCRPPCPPPCRPPCNAPCRPPSWVLTLCDVSDTLTEWKSESMTNQPTDWHGYVLEILAHVKIIILYLYSDILIIINQFPFTVFQPSPPWNYLETSFKHKLVNPRQQISTLANTYQPLSTNINPCQHMNLNLMFVNTENHSWISDAEKYISPFVVHFWRICILAVGPKALGHIKCFRSLHDLVSLWGRQPSEARQWGLRECRWKIFTSVPGHAIPVENTTTSTLT